MIGERRSVALPQWLQVMVEMAPVTKGTGRIFFVPHGPMKLLMLLLLAVSLSTMRIRPAELSTPQSSETRVGCRGLRLVGGGALGNEFLTVVFEQNV